jgi:hypothetical protein
MSTDSAETVDQKAKARSRIANGSSLYLGTAAGEPVDGRTVQARVFRDTLAEIVADMGGRDMISEGEFQLARRAAALSVECLISESHQATGKRLDLETFIPAVNALNRTLGNLGLKRRQRDVTPDPLAYIQGKV